MTHARDRPARSGSLSRRRHSLAAGSRPSPSRSSRTSSASRTRRRSTSSPSSSRPSRPGRGAPSSPRSRPSSSTTSCSSTPATRSRSPSPGELVNLVLLLFVGIVVGQLAALQRTRTQEALAREREARSLFQVSRALATRSSTPRCPARRSPGSFATTPAMTRVWITLGPDQSSRARRRRHGRRVDLPSAGAASRPPTDAGRHAGPWSKVHRQAAKRARPQADVDVYRVRIEAAGARRTDRSGRVRPRSAAPAGPDGDAAARRRARISSARRSARIGSPPRHRRPSSRARARR